MCQIICVHMSQRMVLHKAENGRGAKSSDITNVSTMRKQWVTGKWVQWARGTWGCSLWQGAGGGVGRLRIGCGLEAWYILEIWKKRMVYVKTFLVTWLPKNPCRDSELMIGGYIHRAPRCWALSVTVTFLSLLSRALATNCISHFENEKKIQFICTYIITFPSVPLIRIWQDSHTSPISGCVSSISQSVISFWSDISVANQKHKHDSTWVNLNATSATTGSIGSFIFFELQHHKDNWGMRTVPGS